MKQTAVMIFLLLVSALSAIVCLPGTGTLTEPKETTFAYHTGADDYRFYGSSTWAVRFNFSSVYPSDPDCYFAAQAAVLWFPQTGDSVKVELFTEAAGQPAQRLALVSAPVTSQSIVLPFPQTVQAQVVWMLVTYNTNFANRFVAASSGGGTRSYYLNTNAEHPYLQSLASAGYSAELLFGIRGDFVTTYTDLELRTLDFSGGLFPREHVYPSFSIYNHSTLSISDASLNLVITSPIVSFSQNLTIPVQETILPQSLYTWNPDSQGYYSYGITLPDNPLMFKVRGVLSAASATADTVSNNSITNYFQAFSDLPPLHLVESFARYSNAADLLSQQNSFVDPSVHSLLYIPNLSDTLSTTDSMLRFNWYLFNSLPRTVIGGDSRITGLNSGYESLYQDLVMDSMDDRTFISDAECRFRNQTQDSITAEVTLYNNNTQLFTSTAEYNLAANCRWFMGLFRAVSIGGQTRWVLHRWISHAADISGNLNAGETSVLSGSITLAGLNLDSNQYRLYYWLQMNNGGRVFYMNWEDLNAHVSTSDEVITPALLRCWPNPLSGNSSLKISFPNDSQTALPQVNIYNLRGQLITSVKITSGKAEIPAGLFPASGIYLVKVVFTHGDGRSTTQTKRITIIK